MTNTLFNTPFKVDEATRTTKREDLPPLSEGIGPRGALAELLAGVKMRYHFTNEGAPFEELIFDAMTIEWPDGLQLLIPGAGVLAIQQAIDKFKDSGAVLRSLHDCYKDIVFCYEVV